MADNPEEQRKRYIVLTEVEQAFKELKNDLNIRLIYHQKDDRELILLRYTQPGKDIQLFLHQFNLILPEQPPPRIEELKKKCGADL